VIAMPRRNSAGIQLSDALISGWEDPVIRILLVEDNPDLSRRLTEGLRGAGFVVEHAADGEMGHRLGRS
jgi:hypothetical protein